MKKKLRFPWVFDIYISFFYKGFFLKEPFKYLSKKCKAFDGTFYAYYNPQNPKKSFLTKKGCISNIILMFLFSLFWASLTASFYNDRMFSFSDLISNTLNLINNFVENINLLISKILN